MLTKHNNSYMNSQVLRKDNYSMVLTVTLELVYDIVLNIQSSNLQKPLVEINRLKNVDHEDTVLRTFILFVQTAREVLKYAEPIYMEKYVCR